MRTLIKALMVFGFGVVAVAVVEGPGAQAADLSMRPAKRVVHHHKHFILRDYDGTAIRLGRYRPTYLVAMAASSSPAKDGLCRTYPIMAQTRIRIPYISRDGGCCAPSSGRYSYANRYRD